MDRRKLVCNEENNEFYKKFKMDELHILNLPNEITIQIFKHLSKTVRICLTSVCSAWHDIVKTHFPSDICVYITGDMDFRASGPLFTTFVNRTDRDKERRTFENLVFTLKPSQEDNPQQFLDFIELIGVEIKNLEIKLSENDCNYFDEDPLYDFDKFFENLYKKLSSLQNLEVKREWMVNFHVLRKLNSLKVNGPVSEFMLNIIFNREVTKKFTCESFASFYHSQYRTRFGFCPNFMANELYDLHKEIIGPNEVVNCNFGLNSNFDFCQEQKMNIQHITGLKLTKISTIPPIVKCTNLKELELTVDAENIFGTNLFKHPGVVKLSLGGRCLSSQLNKFFTCFENIESFTVISGYGILEDHHFSEISQNWPQLKELFLNGFHNFSVEHLFQRGNNNLTMTHLETLYLDIYRLDFFNHNREEFFWLDFPKLKQVFLKGDCFSRLPMSFYHSIPMQSPNVSEFELNTTDTKFPNEYFIPMIRTWGSNLQQFILYGEGGFTNYQTGSNDLLYNELIENCKNLEILYIIDSTPILLIQMFRLFKSLLRLKKITLEMYTKGEQNIIREMTRQEYDGSAPYLHLE
uniref:CSON012583 protein n=1 Tax=Culicoides sonorensis TaxID=179676 RepID=A0A336M9Z1_CULSO